MFIREQRPLYMSSDQHESRSPVWKLGQNICTESKPCGERVHVGGLGQRRTGRLLLHCPRKRQHSSCPWPLPAPVRMSMAAGHLPRSPKPSGAATASLARRTGPGLLFCLFPAVPLAPGQGCRPLPPGRARPGRVPSCSRCSVAVGPRRPCWWDSASHTCPGGERGGHHERSVYLGQQTPRSGGFIWGWREGWQASREGAPGGGTSLCKGRAPVKDPVGLVYSEAGESSRPRALDSR